MNDTKALTKSYFMHEWWHPSVQKRLRSRDASSRGSRLDSTRLIWLSVIKKFQHYNCTSCILHPSVWYLSSCNLEPTFTGQWDRERYGKKKSFLKKQRRRTWNKTWRRFALKWNARLKSSDKFQDAITFWGQQRSNHSNHENKSQTFAKCTSFTNDIRDERLSHSRWLFVTYGL